ncbi:unnamed protein product, partial [Onchocerca flexuosa]|uniref:SERPIN domain-containing protein n=1 Tax=Onchocerca flexuosa TaxID=387005 RepID=A0A183HK22_9BILA
PVVNNCSQEYAILFHLLYSPSLLISYISRYSDIFLTTIGQISSEKVTGNLRETTLQKKQSIVRLLKEPEISLADKKDTLRVEQDEKPSTNAYFMASESEIKDVQADIIFDTPFLYMIVSKSETGRLLVVSMGRFYSDTLQTNIQEINPPENMRDFDVPVLSTDDNINRNVYRNG